MASVKVPRDLSQFEDKIFKLTKRQLFSFGMAALTGFPVFFLCKARMPIDLAVIMLGLVALPWMLIAWIDKDGLKAEQYLLYWYRHNVWQNKLRLKERVKREVQRQTKTATEKNQ